MTFRDREGNVITKAKWEELSQDSTYCLLEHEHVKLAKLNLCHVAVWVGKENARFAVAIRDNETDTILKEFTCETEEDTRKAFNEMLAISKSNASDFAQHTTGLVGSMIAFVKALDLEEASAVDLVAACVDAIAEEMRRLHTAAKEKVAVGTPTAKATREDEFQSAEPRLDAHMPIHKLVETLTSTLQTIATKRRAWKAQLGAQLDDIQELRTHLDL